MLIITVRFLLTRLSISWRQEIAKEESEINNQKLGKQSEVKISETARKATRGFRFNFFIKDKTK